MNTISLNHVQLAIYCPQMICVFGNSIVYAWENSLQSYKQLCVGKRKRCNGLCGLRKGGQRISSFYFGPCFFMNVNFEKVVFPIFCLGKSKAAGKWS